MVLLPLRQTVIAKLVPDPFGRAVRVPLPVTVAFHLLCKGWAPMSWMVDDRGSCR